MFVKCYELVIYLLNIDRSELWHIGLQNSVLSSGYCQCGVSASFMPCSELHPFLGILSHSQYNFNSFEVSS